MRIVFVEMLVIFLYFIGSAAGLSPNSVGVVA